MKDEDEFQIDFSKIKRLFKRSETDKVQAAEREAETAKEEVSPAQRPQVESAEQDLKEAEDEARIVDAEERLVERRIERDRKRIHQAEVRSEEEEDIKIDWSKVSGFFKGLGKKGPKEPSEDRIDLSGVLPFLKRHRTLLLLLIPLILSLYLRLIPASLPITDDWASSTIDNNLRQQIAAEVQAQNPNLRPEVLNQAINEQVQAFREQNQELVEQETARLSEQFKSQLRKDDQTYLLAIDPYFWLRHAENVLENGHPGDELRSLSTREPCQQRSSDCVPWDTKMFAPLGRPVPGDMFHAYAIAYAHKFVSIFRPAQGTMTTSFYLPVILGALAVIPAFFIARRISGDFGGLIAGIFVAIHPAFLTRTAGGFSDTDAYNVLIPLLATWLFLEAFEAKKRWKNVVFSVLAGVVTSTFIWAWGAGWWYILDLLVIAAIGFLGIFALIHRREWRTLHRLPTVKSTGIVVGAYLLTTMVVTSLIASFEVWLSAFTGPLGFAQLKTVGITVWPNVFTTVAEQNPASLANVVGQIGLGRVVLFLIATVGIAWTLIRHDRQRIEDTYYAVGSLVFYAIVLIWARQQNYVVDLFVFLILLALPLAAKLLYDIYQRREDVDFKLAIILILWFTSTMYASTKGVRFLLILVPAYAIGFGIASGFLFRQVPILVRKGLSIDERWARWILAALIFLVIFVNIPANRASPWASARSIAYQEVPSMNDGWYGALENIDIVAEPDAIINSWWDFGHWFKYIGNRAVTFDGTSQNSPMAHWIGHVLLTDDEEKAVGILRMLDCGSNSAFNVLDEEVGDTARSVQLLHRIVALDEDEARQALEEQVSPATAEDVLAYTHCEPPENYFITSDDMVGKSGVWAHFGSWDFDRATIYNTLRQREYRRDRQRAIDFLQERFNYSAERAEELYVEVLGIQTNDQANAWIAPWPSYGSGVANCQTEENGTILCPIPVQGGALDMRIDLEEQTAGAQLPDGRVIIPDAVFAQTADEDISFPVEDGERLGGAITLLPRSETEYAFIISAPPLQESMFTRLFFMEGHGLEHFKKLTDGQSFNGNRIIVWSVDWDGGEENVHPVYQEE